MESVLVGLFDTREAAEVARTQLLGAGLSPGPVTAGSGGAAGAAGATTTAGSTSGAEHEGAIARFFHSIFGEDSADADEHRSTYGEALRRGGYALTVTAMDETQIDRAESILNSAGAIDVDERASQWRAEGWNGGTTARAGEATAGTASGVAAGGATQVLQEVQEELKVGKRAVSRGGVRVFSRVREVPVEESVTLREEHATIQRRAVDRPATEADFAAFKEGELEVREMAEEAVVGKTARVVGEVEVGKVATERQETVRDTVRRTEVEVEQLDTAGTTAGSTAAGAGSTSGTAVRGMSAGTSGAGATTAGTAAAGTPSGAGPSGSGALGSGTSGTTGGTQR